VSPQQTIAHYRITGKLGAGGMGEVWRATDTKLGRDVAIKLLTEAFAADPDRMLRFTREAQVLASLNHPNIAAIYGVEERALVMELVEGSTLAERIERGPVPLEEALPIARQIVEALEYAHEKGIVHRDLKPANIKITPEGRVKVLDFGLAKALDAGPPSSDPASSPTLTLSATRAGTLLGTAAYMSPEQARGAATDRRSDIWAFGAVLYEMLAGRRPFAGDTVSDILAGILKTDPDWSALPPETPAAIRRLLRRALERDRKHRLPDIGAARLELDDVQEAAALSAPAVSASRRRWPVAAAAALAVGAALGWFAATLRQPASEARTLNLQIDPEPGTDFALGLSASAAISPDGRMVVYTAVSGSGRKLWLKPLDGVAREMSGTEGAELPFWSPDSRSVGFFAGSRLKRVEVAGGPPTPLADASTPRGGSWNADGTILFSNVTGGVRRVSASGGVAVAVTTLDRDSEENSHRWPSFLPDGRRFLYYTQGGKPHAAGVYLASLDKPQLRIKVVESTENAVYLPPRGDRPGCLLWLRGSALTAQAFDPVTGRLVGQPSPVPGGERVGWTSAIGHAQFSVADNGTILFASGADHYLLTWYDRGGRPLGTTGRAEQYAGFRLAPDGVRAVASIVNAQGLRDFWLLDLVRGLPTRLTSRGVAGAAIWSPDGKRIAAHRLNNFQLFEIPASGVGEEKIVVEAQHNVYINDWSPDGRFLLYSQASAESGYDLWVLPLAAGSKPAPFQATQYNESSGQFSPDGKWLAYVSDESGRSEIYVRSFAGGGDKWVVSNSGGSYPRWLRDGKELLYQGLEGMLMSVAVKPTAQGLEFGTPAPLFRILGASGGAFAYPFDVSPDGKRILAMAPATGVRDTPSLTVLMNWDRGWKK
jgi:Tol biopolymer transport system component